LIQLISTSKFRKANINPMPGLQVNIDEQMGVIRTVSGGRILVDFNHPLSGKDVIYKVNIISKIDDTVKKVSSLFGAMLQIDEPEVKIAEGKADVTLAFELPKDVQDILKKKVLEVVTDIKEITIKKKEDKKEEKKAEGSQPKA